MSFAADAVAEGAVALVAAQQKHAIKMARKYIRFCRMANGTEGARYSMAEYLKIQGVRADLIPSACQVVEEAYGSA